MPLTAGIDSGSTALKLVIMEGGRIVEQGLERTSPDPQQGMRALLGRIPGGCPIVATGYGRDWLEIEHGLPTITEIKAHAIGASHLVPGCRAVVDIGGQDVKMIQLDASGKVQKFHMNDRCAAGTGRFLEIMAERLGCSLEAFALASAQGAEGLRINAMCTVFAESEVVGLLGRGCAREDIGRALHRSIATRIAAMLGPGGPGEGGAVL
ncbi:MAG TPA: acyl-CoA dehydratase activase, partial [Holophaga sp.]|nr:acyl-CoA dehydratase activase [Holophaga sp.]